MIIGKSTRLASARRRFRHGLHDRYAQGEPPTTLLSPYVAFGCVSVRTFHAELARVYAKGAHAQPPTSLLGQLYFREMSYLLGKKHGAPFAEQPSPVCKDIDWDTDEAAEKRFEAWEQGKTGYPLIDAAMRQLREQGWLHHLARHAVSCFLTRGNLLCINQPVSRVR